MILRKRLWSITQYSFKNCCKSLSLLFYFLEVKEMQTDKRLAIAEEKIKYVIEIIKEQGVGMGGVSEAKVLDALDIAHSLLREVIKKN